MAKADNLAKSSKPNIRLIAREAGVSVSTVSRYLNNTSYVGSETRKKIRQTVEKYDYRPNFIAQSLARGHARIIGILAEETDNPSITDCIKGVLHRLKGTGLSVLTTYGGPDNPAETDLTDLFVRIQAMGILIMPQEETEDSKAFAERLNYLAKVKGIPIALSGAREGCEDLDCVTYDSKATGYAATMHLIDKGFERVGCITGNLRSMDGRLRYEGYRQALVEANIKFDPRLVYQGHWHKEDGYKALHHFHENKCMPRAIFCCNDVMALGTLLAAEELGIKIPSDVAVIGCDNIELTKIVTPKLSTVNFEGQKNGELLVDFILRRIEHPDTPPQHVSLQPIIIERESTAIR